MILLLIIIILCIILLYYNYIHKKEYFTENTYNVYVLYIEKRYTYIKSILDKIFDNVIYIKGPDKKDFENKDELIKKNIILSKYSSYNSGRVACHLGHIFILKEFIKSNKKYALIFEDDIYINEEYKIIQNKLNNIITNIPNDADIIYIDYCYEICTTHKDLFNKSESPACRHCYIVSKNGANKIINNTLPMYHNGDQMMANMIRNNLLISYTINKDYINIKQNRDNMGSTLNNLNTIQKCLY